MSGDADTVREALGHMTYNGPVTRAAKAALARLEACEAQRDALLKTVALAGVPLEVLRSQIETKPYRELTKAFQETIVATTEIVRAALAEAAT